jgi:uncharacterized protein
MDKTRNIVSRRFAWKFSDSPRYWANGSVVLTHLLNTYTVLVPDNEKFYIRVLSSCSDKLSDPRIERDLLDFCRQESLHGVAHRKHWAALCAADPSTEKFTRWVNWLLYDVMEKLQPKPVRVSVVAAIEHINASMGHAFLKANLLENSDPDLRDLFYWHFAEEIEHKAVAHDVLEHTYPGYLIRLMGAVLAFPVFLLLLTTGVVFFSRAERHSGQCSLLRDLNRNVLKSGLLRSVLSDMGRYLLPGFSPWDVDDESLTVATIQRIAYGRERLGQVAQAAP